jgi:predicted glycogen debranching enzyme
MSPSDSPIEILPDPINIAIGEHDLPNLLSREWLLTNRIGSYAASSVVGCNTRRYHGLLVAATEPPVSRVATLATVMEQVIAGQRSWQTATNEFVGSFAPEGFHLLESYSDDVAPTWVFAMDEFRLTRQIMLEESDNGLAVRYRVEGGDVRLRLDPFLAMRDFHHLRKLGTGDELTFEVESDHVVIHEYTHHVPPVYMSSDLGHFQPDPIWWYRFQYRVDLARGQDSFEDLWSPGQWWIDLPEDQWVQLSVTLHSPRHVDFQSNADRRRERLQQRVDGLGPDADDADKRLAMAGGAYVVDRRFPNRPASLTILAGYPWFADWGRDTFIALPGLLLETGQFDQAKQVFRTFADHMQDGMVPNRFDDYSTTCHYNSIDASLWFILAAERYMRLANDTEFWNNTLQPAVRAILRSYREGTHFGIHADGDGLLAGGSENTQLTWMDAALGDEVVTPRHGKAVEVNALWYCAHRILAHRARGVDDALAANAESLAERIGKAFNNTFWNHELGWLHDCVTYGQADASLRPNQILAVSVPYSPLDADRRRAVTSIVLQKLLTPCGLRTLSPDDRRYRRRYGGSWESRDRAYHQGTVWAWLMGPFIEAYLKVEGDAPISIDQAWKWLRPLEEHLRQAGLGQISEIFDAEEPHHPRGCPAQAWSVAEVLRARRLVRSAANRMRRSDG